VCRPVYRGEEPVATSRYRLDEAGILGSVPQGVPKPADGSVEAVIEIDKRIRWPQTGPELVASDHLAGSFQQEGKNLKGLFLKSYSRSVTAQLAGSQINLEDSELDHSCPVAAGYFHFRSVQFPEV
jgi:hypothetical protein